MVDRFKLQIIRIARPPLKAVGGQRGAKRNHLPVAVVDPVPKHLQFAVGQCTVARPVKEILRYAVVIEARSLRVVNMGERLVISCCAGVSGLVEPGKPKQRFILPDRITLIIGTLRHYGVTRETACTARTCGSISHAIETVVESPIHMSTWQPDGKHAVAPVPTQRAGE